MYIKMNLVQLNTSAWQLLNGECQLNHGQEANWDDINQQIFKVF